MAGSCRLLTASISQLLLRRKGRGAALLLWGRRSCPESCGGQAGREWSRVQENRRWLERSYCSGQKSYGSFQNSWYLPLPEYDPQPLANHLTTMFIVRVRGLPWSCTADDVLNFFGDSNVRNGTEGVHFIFNRDGKPRGDAVIEFESAEDVQKAVEQHKKYMGQRYVEVFEMNQKEAESLLNRMHSALSPTRPSSMSLSPQSSMASPPSDGVVRLRGLPYSCSEQDIIHFFSGLDIPDEGITFVLDQRGRKSGEAFVQFLSQEHADQALLKHKQEIGSRYIEIFPSRRNEIQTARFPFRRRKGVTFAPGIKDLYDPDNCINNTSKDLLSDIPENGHINDYVKEMSAKSVDVHDFTVMSPVHDIHIRGLPFHASGQDIANFFHPIMPLKISIEYSADAGGATGEAVVRFLTHDDAVGAMAKNRCHSQHGYLELYLNSSQDSK
ncbi:G-rich sequence factor 1 isoform X2 [Xenopus laevis]|uniref:G-rich sequence factor 1 isoform X2 n=1 Tax=Xenopus laevis TaxID=8355 RepID=A0A8J0TVW4_XENLA|nr:G-rich sequence factor 1 isoform X2 [Xenopus laevis]